VQRRADEDRVRAKSLHDVRELEARCHVRSTR
jgi:hypothetical protein